MNLKIREERTKNGWKLSFVAEQVGLTTAAYRNIEVGQRKPSYNVLVKLLDLFNYNDPRLLFAEAFGKDTQVKKTSGGMDNESRKNDPGTGGGD